MALKNRYSYNFRGYHASRLSFKEVLNPFFLMLTVMKFGGSILSSESQLKRVTQVVKKRREREDVLIVVSALKGVTNSLIGIANKALEGSDFKEEFVAVKKLHLEMLSGIKAKNYVKETEKGLLEEFSLLERALQGILCLKELSPRSLDLVQTAGERLCVLLLFAYLLDENIQAIAFDGRKQGIVTNSDFGRARPLMDETKKKLEKTKGFVHSNVLIFPGFFGVDKQDNVVSFGRGGSDFSAAILANLFRANSLELWKDVDGFLTSDPKIVEDAVVLSNLSYEEAEELGYFGAKIIYPRTVVPLKEKGIKIVIKNIQKPDKIGTIVSNERLEQKIVAKSIAVKRNIASITLRSPIFVGQAGVLEKIFYEIAKANISVGLVATSETGISFTIDEKSLPRTREAISRIGLVLEEASFDKDLAMVGVVGEGLKKKPGVAGFVFGCLAENKVNVEMISQGSSGINISFIIKESDLHKTVKALHKKIIQNPKMKNSLIK